MWQKCSFGKTYSVYIIQYTHSLAVLGSLKHPSTSILNVFHRDVNYDAYHIILSWEKKCTCDYSLHEYQKRFLLYIVPIKFLPYICEHCPSIP